MDSKLEEWDVYVSPTIREEFNINTAKKRSRNDYRNYKDLNEEYLNEILGRIREKLKEISQEVYIFTPECSEASEVIHESEIWKRYQDLFPEMSREEKSDFGWKSILPQKNDVRYISEVEKTFLEEVPDIYEEVYLISEDRHITAPRFVDSLRCEDLDVIDMREILASERGSEESEKLQESLVKI